MSKVSIHPGSHHGTEATRAVAMRGFTLIELMVTIAVLAVVLAVGFPNFVALINSNRLTGAANDLVGDIQYARTEAVRRNARVTMCASADNLNCAGAAGNWQSWIVVVENVAPAANEVLRSGHIKAPLQVLASPGFTAAGGTDNRIVFRSTGLARVANGGLLAASLATCIPTTKPADNVRVIGIFAGSKVSATRSGDSGACNVPAN